MRRAKKSTVAKQVIATSMLKNYYPFPQFRPGVEGALVKIEEAVAAGKRFVCMRAPTGAGKSAIAAAWTRKFGGIVLTPTKLLQQQYADTPEFLGKEWVVKGKANYQCAIDKLETVMVDEAICCSDAVTKANRELIPWNDDPEFWKLDERPSQALKKKCAATNTCPYYSLISQISRKPGAVLNYDLFVHIKPMPGGKKGVEIGKFIVMDEAHQIISKIKSAFGYKVANLHAVRVLGDKAARKKNEPAITWLYRLSSLAHTVLKTETDQKIAGSVLRFVNRLDKALEQDIGKAEKFHIDDSFEEVEVKPLDFRHLKEALFGPYQHVLLLSATFPHNFCELLGITPEETAVIEIPSTFPAKNRPAIVVKGMPSINYETVLDGKHPAKIALDLILEEHADQKGIIHCSNYKFFNQLRQNYRGNKRFLWVDRDDDKTEFLKRHTEAKTGTVLVSPSMMEGVDLKDDLARFQVLLKLPYPALDDYTRKMMAIFPNYYENLVATSIVQAYGRAVRSETDQARFYILDGNIQRLLAQHRKLFSPYFTEALCSLSIT